MSALQASHFSAAGESTGKKNLPVGLLEGPTSRYVLQEAIIALQANKRRGTSSTKTRGLVSGGGRKPWKQKGTGNARSGSNRSPLWRKGGIIFGPSPRSYRIELNGAKKIMALQTALVEKAKASELIVIDSLNAEEAKTRPFELLLKKTGAGRNTVLVLDQKSDALARALRNIAWLRLVDVKELNAWHLLSGKQILFTQSSLDALMSRFPKG